MSRTVHLLKFYEEHTKFIEEISQEKYFKAIFSFGNTNDVAFKELVDKFNSDNNIRPDCNFHKGLSLPRLKILLALIAQKKGCIINPSLSHGLHLDNTPARFQTKFKPLLVSGIWLLGTVIEDSLSEDPAVNCGNPFGFLHGDLGYWWAGSIIMDWLNHQNTKQPGKKSYKYCLDFYNDPCISRKYKTFQNSALSSFDRIPQQFLGDSEMESVLSTIKRVDLNKQHFWNQLLALAIDDMTGHATNE